jgi:ribosomal protein S18 acetylase RimI-like enzyme
MEIRRVSDVAGVVAASHLFDYPARPDWSQRFVSAPGHHLLVAYQDGVPVGLVTGVELTHPDKDTEMFLYELGVDEAYQRRGIGRALVAALAGLARQRDCYGMWVLTEPDNAAAQATYRAAGARQLTQAVMLEWSFDPS